MSTLTKEQIADSLYNLSDTQKKSLESCASQLVEIMKNGKVSENNLRALSNIWREVDSLRELFFTRLLNSAKRGDILD